jgi:hypothetical protein
MFREDFERAIDSMKDPKVRAFVQDLLAEVESGNYVPRGRWVETDGLEKP